MTNSLNKTFDIDVEVTEVTPIKKEIVTKAKDASTEIANKVAEIKSQQLEQYLTDDLNVSRKDLDTIIDLGKDALAEVLQIATDGQHPRFFEAAALLIKSINEANRERMELHLKLSQIRRNQAEIENPAKSITVEKGLFLGTTQQLLEMLNTGKKTLKHEPADTPNAE